MKSEETVGPAVVGLFAVRLAGRLVVPALTWPPVPPGRHSGGLGGMSPLWLWREMDIEDVNGWQRVMLLLVVVGLWRQRKGRKVLGGRLSEWWKVELFLQS